MTGDEPRPVLDVFASWLAQADDALRAGQNPPLYLPPRLGGDTEGGADTPPPLQPELQNDLAYLQKLRRVLRRPVAGVPCFRGPGTELARPDLDGPRKHGTPAGGHLGRFQIRCELGGGGFGVVYLAYDPRLRREVALKVPRPEILITPELRQRFHREAQAAAGLDHPNLVPVHEAGDIGPVCFLVSAYCPGPTLAAWLRQRSQPVPYRQAAGLVATLADAVYHAHCLGVVHRDLKPANILLVPAREQQAEDLASVKELEKYTPKITDFGLAEHCGLGHGLQTGPSAGTMDQDLTRSGAILGTAGYMAPEQAGGKTHEIGPAADIYGLGAILYEVLVGRPPFQGETELETLIQVREEDPVSLARLRSGMPRDLETICLKSLHKEPGRRYATAAALADDLRRFLAGQTIRARPVGRVERLWRWSRRNPALAAASGLAAAALLAVAGVSLAFAFHQRSAAERIGREQVKTKDALEEVEKQYTLAERRSALLALDRGLALCEQGQVGQGMLWLAQSLEIAAQLPRAQAADLEWLARANLAHWCHELLPLRAMLPDPKGIRAVAFTPDGRIVLTGSGGGTVQLWEAATGKPVRPPLQHQDAVAPVAFSANGRLFVTGSRDKSARPWEAATGQPLGPPLLHPENIRAVAISPDGRTIFTECDDHLGRFWDTATGKLIGAPLVHVNFVHAVAFSPHGRTLATCDAAVVQLWEVSTHKLLRPALQHEGPVQSVAFSSDGRMIATGSNDKTARLWESDTGKPIGLRLQHRDEVLSVAFSPDGRTLITGCSDRTARLWDVATGKPIGRPLAHPEQVNAAVYSPDGRTILTVGWTEGACLWEVASDRSAIPPLKHPDEVRAVAYSPDGQTVLTGCKDGIGRFWEAATGKLLDPMLYHQGRILAVAFSPDGRTVLTGSADETARLWETATGKPVGSLLRHTSQVNAVAYSPDGGTVLTGSGDRTARFWEATTGKPLGQPLRHPSTVEAVAYSPDGRTVLTCDAFNAVHFWEAATGELLGSAVYHPKNGVFDLAFSPDGRTILTGGRDMTARLWDATTRQPSSPPLPHQASVKSVAFSPHGRIVLTGSYDWTARLWATNTGKPIGPPLLHEAEVAAVAFSPDGRTVLTGSYDGTVRFWSVPAPVAGEPERIRLWVEVITGMELDSSNVIHLLDATTWQDRKHRLEQLGSPPAP